MAKPIEESKEGVLEKRLMQERKARLVTSDVSKYYQDLLPNKVRTTET